MRGRQLLLSVFTLPDEERGKLYLSGPAFQLHVRLLRGRGGAVQTLRHGLPVGYEKALRLQYDRAVGRFCH